MNRQNQYLPESSPHPGEILAEKLEEMNMGPKEFAVRTGKPEKTISAVLNGESAITPDMAVQFENVTQIPARFWLNSQRSYDEFIARNKHNTIIRQAADWARNFPVAAMIKLGWIGKHTNIHDKTSELLNFFGFASHKGWENFYIHQQLKVSFRISLANTAYPYAISAWLRRGEIQASQLNAGEYSVQKFKSVLPGIKELMVTHPDDYFARLQSECLKAGVKVVYTPAIPKAPINGCTRWFKDAPLIQLTDRYKRNDIFWFTFFHEAGHILLHGKKDVFLEDGGFKKTNPEKEQEADDFAVKWTLSHSQEKELLASGPIDDEKIKSFADKFGTHPAIIVGRLQRQNFISQSSFIHFFIKIEPSDFEIMETV